MKNCDQNLSKYEILNNKNEKCYTTWVNVTPKNVVISAFVTFVTPETIFQFWRAQVVVMTTKIALIDNEISKISLYSENVTCYTTFKISQQCRVGKKWCNRRNSVTSLFLLCFFRVVSVTMV